MAVVFRFRVLGTALTLYALCVFLALLLPSARLFGLESEESLLHASSSSSPDDEREVPRPPFARPEEKTPRPGQELDLNNWDLDDATRDSNHGTPAEQAAALHSTLFEDTSWHRFVDVPESPLVQPRDVAVEYARGNVVGADALVGKGEGPAVLTRWNESEEEPVVVLDLGRNAVGLVVIEFEGSRRTRDDEDEDEEEEGLHRPGLRLSFSETMEYLGDKSDFSRSYNIRNENDKLTPGTDQIAVPPTPFTYLSQLGCLHPRTKQVCSDGLHGFRYLRLSLSSLPSDTPYTQPHGQVVIKSVRLRLSAYLGTPDTFRGWFECSDAGLTRYWYQGVYTNDLCADEFRANDTEPRDATAPGLLGKMVLHDGAKRDRDPYVGDLAVSGLTAYLTRDYAEGAVGNVLEDLATHQRDDGWIPPASILNYSLHLFDYPLWWVVCAYQHVLHTGNISFAISTYPAVQKVLDRYYPSTTNGTLGLLQKGMGMRASNGYGDYAFLPRQGIVTYYNALYVLALRAAAEFAAHPAVSAFGEDGRRWADRAERVAEALRDVTWDEQAGAFWDGQCECGKWCPTHAQDGNFIAILAGIVDPVEDPKAMSILQHFTKHSMRDWGNAFYDSGAPRPEFEDRVYPFISHFEISARFLVPRHAPSALDQLRRTYGTMLSHGPGTFWEGIGAGGSAYEGGFTSMAHGWSTGVVSSLTGKVLGVEPGDHGWGWKRWRVRPLRWEGMVADRDESAQHHRGFEHTPVTWAKGVVPTPKGEIAVSWRMTSINDNLVYTLSVTAPRGTVGEIWLPVPEGFDRGPGSNGWRTRVRLIRRNADALANGAKEGVEVLSEKWKDARGYQRYVFSDWGGDDLAYVFQVRSVPLSKEDEEDENEKPVID